MAIYTEETDGNLIDNSAKKELITEIKEIISDYGSFGTGEAKKELLKQKQIKELEEKIAKLKAE